MGVGRGGEGIAPADVGPEDAVPQRGNEILATMLEPLKRRLKPRAYQRLLKALAVVYGIEPMIILNDICRATDRETEAVVRWMTDALVDAALREAR
jgi:hypothetical protein